MRAETEKDKSKPGGGVKVTGIWIPQFPPFLVPGSGVPWQLGARISICPFNGQEGVSTYVSI